MADADPEVGEPHQAREREASASLFHAFWRCRGGAEDRLRSPSRARSGRRCDLLPRHRVGSSTAPRDGSECSGRSRPPAPLRPFRVGERLRQRDRDGAYPAARCGRNAHGSLRSLGGRHRRPLRSSMHRSPALSKPSTPEVWVLRGRKSTHSGWMESHPKRDPATLHGWPRFVHPAPTGAPEHNPQSPPPRQVPCGRSPMRRLARSLRIELLAPWPSESARARQRRVPVVASRMTLPSGIPGRGAG